MNEYYDVIVVGAGPAGSTAARYAAEGGASVLMLEKDRDVGYPVRCGEAVRKSGLEEFITPDPRWIASEVKHFKLVAPNGAIVEPNLGADAGYILERRIFDYELARQASQFGVKVLTKAYVNGLIKRNGRVEGVRFAHNGHEREVCSQIVIGADGVESRVGRWAGLNTTTSIFDMQSCVQMTLSNIEVEDGTCYFYFGTNYAPSGYLWIFPKGKNSANVGLGISTYAAKRRSPISYLEEFVQKRFPKAAVLTTVAGGVPCAQTLEHIVADGVMLVGDAAHQVNPMSGGGIISGMIGGKIAGQIAAKAIRERNLDLIYEYEEEWDNRLGKRHRIYYHIKEVVNKLSDDTLNSIAETLQKIEPGKITLFQIFKTALINQPKLILDLPKLFMQ